MPGSQSHSPTSASVEQLRVAVLMGGIGVERQVSLRSGRCIARALRQAGPAVVTADVNPEHLEILDDSSIDVFFLGLHGRFGEDGQLQRILESRNLIYTGSGPAASLAAFDKMAAKKIFLQAGIPTAPAFLYSDECDPHHLAEQLGRPAEGFVVKPVRQGSSVGVQIVTDARRVPAAARRISERFGDCMIEQFIPGREITVGVVNDEALPIIEIRPKTGFYDYRAKYVDKQTDFLFDTIEDETLARRIEGLAMDCFHQLGCRHTGRVDFILADEQKPYVLEVNTIPGFTDHSLLPMAAERKGYSMSDLCLAILEAAWKDALYRAGRLNLAGKGRA